MFNSNDLTLFSFIIAKIIICYACSKTMAHLHIQGTALKVFIYKLVIPTKFMVHF